MNLTPYLIKSKELLQTLPEPYYIQGLLASAKSAGYRLDWDGKYVEKMGRLFCKEELVAIFFAYLPLVFVHTSARKTLEKAYDKSGAIQPVMVEIIDFTNQYVSATEEAKNIIDWHSDSVSIDTFSILDLYYTGV